MDSLFATGAESLSRLRQLATQAAIVIERPLYLTPTHGWRAKTRLMRTRHKARLDIICQCIEVLVVDGDYTWERERAMDLARVWLANNK